MLSRKTKFLLIAKAMYFSNPIWYNTNFYFKPISFLHYQMSLIQHLLLGLKFLSSSTDMTRFVLKWLFIIFLIHIFKNYCIFSSVKDKWPAKFIINTYSFASKTAWNVFLIPFLYKKRHYRCHCHYFKLLLKQIQKST